MDKSICRKCNQIKWRSPAGQYGNQKDTKYIDENGRQWSGRTCADCHADLTRIRQRAKRAKKV